MKKILSFLLACSLATSMIGCGNTNTAPQGSEENTPGETTSTKVEKLIIGTTGDIEPTSMRSESGSYGKMNYNGFCAGTWLVRDSESKLAPNLMTDWEIAEDGQSILATFATDKGVMWHDGTPFTMDDVIYNFSDEDLLGGYFSKVAGIEKISDTQATILLKEPDSAYFTLGNSAVFARAYPKHIWENVEDKVNYMGEDRVIGCGPYKFVGVDEDARTIHYQAVGDTYMGRELTVENVYTKSYDSNDSLVMALATGEVDAMSSYSSPIPPTLLPSMSNVENLDKGESINQGLVQILFGFNQTPTNDFAFRDAVRDSLDYALLAATIGGEDGQIPSKGILTPTNIAFDDSIESLAQNLDLANSKLDEGGYKDVDGDGVRELPTGEAMAVKITPQYSTPKAALYQRIAEILIENLKAVGINAYFDEESARNSEVEAKLRDDKAYEIYIGYSTVGVAFYKTAYLYHATTPISMWGSCNIDEVNQAFADLLVVSGEAEYEEQVTLLQNLGAKYATGIALCWDTAYYPYRTDKYEGWTNYPGWGVINPETWYTLRPITK